MPNKDKIVLDKVIEYLQDSVKRNVQAMYDPKIGIHRNLSRDLLDKIDFWIKEVNIYE